MVTIDSAVLDKLRTFINEKLPTYDVPGTSVVVVQDNDVLMAEGFGLRDREKNLPVTPITMFRIGATYKSMNAMLLAKLVDEGVIQWDQRIQAVYPAFSLADDDLARDLTFRDLLSMQSGLMPSAFSVHCGDSTVRGLLRYLLTVPKVAERGEKFAYDNELFALSGFMAALAAGARLETARDTYQTLAYQHMLLPIGMKRATFFTDLAIICEDAAQSYELMPATGKLEPVKYGDIGCELPAGGLAACAEDIAPYLITQINKGVTAEGKRVVSVENLMETHKPQMTMAENIDYCMGWTRMIRDGHDTLWHNGGVDGFTTDFLMLPDANIGLAVMSNASTGTFFNQSLVGTFINLLNGDDNDIDAAYHGAYQQSRDALNALREKAETLSTELFTEYAGEYEWYIKVEHRADGNLWLMPWGYERPLLPLGDGKFAFSMHTEQLHVQFTDDGAGQMQMQFYNAQTGEALFGTYHKTT